MGAMGAGLALLAAVVLSGLVRADPSRVVAGDVVDDRKSDKTFGFGSLALDLKITADEVAQARNIRAEVTSAVEETGKELVNTHLFSVDWEKIRVGEDKKSTGASVSFDNPARTSKTLREVAGTIELYDPTRDPHAVITVADISGQAGQMLADPTLKAAGLEIAYLNKEQLDLYQKSLAAKPTPNQNPQLTPELKLRLTKALFQLFGGTSVDENGLAFHVTDPNGRLVDIELETAQGQRIETKSRSSTRAFGSDQKLKTYGFRDKIPADARLRIYVAMPQSVTQIPFTLNDVALP